MKKAVLIFFLLIPTLSKGQVITTIIGNGDCGYSGDNGPATSATINNFALGRFDKHGNYYFAQRFQNVVRKVSPSGIITTVAGNDTMGYSGDFGLATLAELNNPEGVAIDTYGNLLISDLDNSRVRRVDASTGIITTFAGNGAVGYSGDNGPATNASISYPTGICTDSFGNVYIADYTNSRIRKVNHSGIITTLDSIYNPNGMSCNNSGYIYVGCGHSIVQKINVITGVVTTIAGTGTAGFSGDGGLADSAELNSLFLDVFADPFGNLYIADTYNNRIRKVNSEGIITTVAGNGTGSYFGDNGPADSAEIYWPEGVAEDTCGNLYIDDLKNCRIRKVSFNPECLPENVQNVNSEQNVTIYPNPASNKINVDNVEPSTICRLINIVGAAVQQNTLKESNNTISIEFLPPGLYLLELTNEEGMRTIKKIIKQ